MWLSRIAIGLVPLGAVALVATRYSHNWYYYDEWSLIQRALDSPNQFRAAFESYNGHLYLFPFLVYRAQLALGLDGHSCIWVIFCVSLVVCNVSVALTLWAAGVPAFGSVVAGAVVTYFGPGAQLVTFEFLLAIVAAVAFSFLAAYVALRKRPSIGPAMTVAVLLLVATGFDSGTASGGVVFVAVLLALRWRDRWALVAAVPPLAAGLAFPIVAGTSPLWTAGLGKEVLFGVRLLLLSFGGLAGGGKIAGGIVLMVACGLIVPAIASRRIPREAGQCLVAGTVAALMMVGVIAAERAELVGSDFFHYNRYVAIVAFYLLVALLPSAVSVVGNLMGRRAGWVGPVTAVLLAVTFLLNLGPLLHYRGIVERLATETHVLVVQASEVLATGCPDGLPVTEDAAPLGSLDPHLTVRLLRQLETRGFLRLVVPAATSVSASVRDAMCPR